MMIKRTVLGIGLAYSGGRSLIVNAFGIGFAVGWLYIWPWVMFEKWHVQLGISLIAPKPDAGELKIISEKDLEKIKIKAAQTHVAKVFDQLRKDVEEKRRVN